MSAWKKKKPAAGAGTPEKRETKPQQDAEYERINHRQIEKFLEDGGDIHTLSWAKEQYPG